MSAGTDYLAKPILDWLRERADGSLAGRKYREAADEIERLRGVLAKAQNDLEDERRQRHFTAGETEKVIRALHAAAVQPSASLLDEAHILICQAVASRNNGGTTTVGTHDGMRAWLEKFADRAAVPTDAAP
jgi:hypothetical protein